MTDYELEIDGLVYKPIPESWITADSAYDPDAPPEAVRLYASSVAAAPTGRALKIRYVHARRDGVLRAYVPAKEQDGSLIPVKLATGEGWARSWLPRKDTEPHDVIRQPEREHFVEIWSDRLDGLEPDAPEAIADGGESA